MTFEFTETDHYCSIRLKGDIVTQYQSTELFEQIEQAFENGVSNLILDLVEMNYINSSGLSLLLNILNTSRKNGGDTVLVNIPDHLMKLLVITKLHSIFSVSINMKEAIVHFEKPANTEISS